jgi:Ca2+-transporting ATPase
MPAREAYDAIEQRETPFSKIDPFLVSGAKVMEGVGTCLVTAVGTYSTFGRTMMSLRRDYEEDRTPLQTRLDALARGIFRLGLYAALVLVIVLCARLLILVFRNNATKTAIDSMGDIGFGQGLRRLFINILFAGQGLPEVLTVALFVSAHGSTCLLDVCRALRRATPIGSDKASELAESECGWNNDPQKGPNRGSIHGASCA